MKAMTLLAAALLTAMPGLAAHAADVAVKTRDAEITVEIDAKLKADAALAANLLAEGKTWAARQQKDATAMRRDDTAEMRKLFPRYTYERSYAPDGATPRYVSIVRTDFVFTGGAHPNTTMDTLLWDASAQKRISIRPFFKETRDDGPTMKALLKLVQAALIKEKKARGTDDGDNAEVKALPAKLIGIGPVSLAPSTEKDRSGGLTFHYEPYAVGAYAEGAYVVTVPWRGFADHFSDEGRALFGGDVPPEPTGDKK